MTGVADESSKHIAKLVSKQRVNTRKSRRISKQPVNTKPLIVPSQCRKNIQELLSVYPNGVLDTAFLSAYNRHYGSQLDYSGLGFRSMPEFFNAMQDIAVIEKYPRGGYRVCAVAKKRMSTSGEYMNSFIVLNCTNDSVVLPSCFFYILCFCYKKCC